MRIGAIEAGGTKFVCGIRNTQGHIEDWCSFPTEHPEITLVKVIDYFRGQGVAAIGIGSFGPIDLQEASPMHPNSCKISINISFRQVWCSMQAYTAHLL